MQVVFRDGEEVDGAGGGCLVGVVCHGGFHLPESKVELDEVRGPKANSTRRRSTL